MQPEDTKRLQDELAERGPDEMRRRLASGEFGPSHHAKHRMVVALLEEHAESKDDKRWREVRDEAKKAIRWAMWTAIGTLAAGVAAIWALYRTF